MMNTNLSEKLTIVRVPVKELKPSAYNPRKWDDKAIADMKESISRFGLCDPLIVNSAPERKNILIGGPPPFESRDTLGIHRSPSRLSQYTRNRKRKRVESAIEQKCRELG